MAREPFRTVVHCLREGWSSVNLVLIKLVQNAPMCKGSGRFHYLCDPSQCGTKLCELRSPSRPDEGPKLVDNLKLRCGAIALLVCPPQQNNGPFLMIQVSECESAKKKQGKSESHLR